MTDLSEAQRFLDLLDPDATSWTFQTFDDNAARKEKSLAQVLHGSLAIHAARLMELEQRGAGVFVTINETDGKGRGAKNITRARAVFVDLDGAPLEPLQAWHQPHIVTATSAGRYHAFWRVCDLPLKEFKGVQKKLIAAFDADKSVNDLPRVMRLPGFDHQKVCEEKGLIGTPYMVKIDAVDDAAVLAWADLQAMLPQGKTQPHTTDLQMTIADATAPLKASGSKIEKALAALSPATLPYGDWIRVGMALCHEFEGGENGFEIWDRWSRQDPRYKGIDDLANRWDSFAEGSDNPVTLRSLLAMAKAAKPDYLLPDWAQGWVYNETLMEFHQIETGHSIKGGAFNAKFNRQQECFEADCSASTLVLQYMNTVANVMFWPCDDRIITHRALDFVNVFRPHDLTPVAAATPDAETAVQRIIDHAYGLITEPGEAELLLDFLAYVYQNPGKRVRWAILLFGIQGNGKSFWVELMKRLLGHNAGEVAGTTVAQRFTGWAIDKLFIAIEEIRVPSESKYAVLDKLKPFISNNEINVEQKGQDDRVVPNFASYLLLTNHDDALPLDDDDRRYCVIETRHRTKADIPSPEYFAALFDALDDHIEAIAHYFATRQISLAFNPNGRAPETSGKFRMMQESKSGPRLALEEAIAELQCDVINDDFVYVGALRNEGRMMLNISLPDARIIGRELKAMGYVKHTIGAQHKGPTIGGRERTIYYRPDKLLPPAFMPIVTQKITGVPF